MKRILSLFDLSGNGPKPWLQYGYSVETLDVEMPEDLYEGRIHYCDDILNFKHEKMAPDRYDALMAFPPCTHFALSGSRWFKDKDADGRTAHSIKLVKKTLAIINYFNPRVWAIENPMSRVHKLVPELGSPRMKFHPFQYGNYSVEKENYYKQTWLWGKFAIPPTDPVEPETRDEDGHGYISRIYWAPKDKRARLRSVTPMGFARAFAQYNAIKD